MADKALDTKKNKSKVKGLEPAHHTDQTPQFLPDNELLARENLPLPHVDPERITSRNVISLQRVTGNRMVTNLLHSDNGAVQRHPEGAQLLQNDQAAVEEAANSRAGQAPMATGEDGGAPAPAGPEAAGPEAAGPAPAGPEAAGPEAAGPAPAGPEAAGPAPAGPEAAGPAPAGPEAAAPAPAGPAPATLTNPTMQSAFSQQAIQALFGASAGRTLIAGNINVVADYNALGAAYDDWCIAHNVTNPRTGVLWAAGDMIANDTANSVRTNAFAEPSPGTGIYIDATGTDPTATVHEMLHINTAADFRSSAGEVVNEGTTQRFAVQAVQAQGASVAGSENTYQAEQGIVQKLVDLVGETTLRTAYFNTPPALITAYEALNGTGSWAALKALLDVRNFASANTLLDTGVVQATAETNQSIAEINDLLRGWVSADDLAQIRTIYNAGNEVAHAAIRAAIEPRTHEAFWRASTRAAVREIIGANS